MRFPIPIFVQEVKYVECSIDNPTGAILADANKAAKGGDYFSSIRVFLNGCIKYIISDQGREITDKIQLKSIISKMPIRTADAVCIDIIKLYNEGEDEIEGMYSCPRCGYRVVCELKESDGMVIDNRDKISDFNVVFYEGETDEVSFQLTKPVRFINEATGQDIEIVEEFSMRFPTIEDGIAAFSKYGGRDEIRLQFAMFCNALRSVNGDEVDNRWKNILGMQFFENIKGTKGELGRIISELRKYGINAEAQKTCPECGKEWRAIVNTSNFFASALRPM